MRRTLFAVVLTALIAAAAALASAWPAAAQPTAVPAPGPGGPAATASAKKLPENFPTDLRKYVAGTDEFKAAPWFTGVCRDKGGDMGQYAGEVMSQEGRLMYWAADADTKLQLWSERIADDRTGPTAAAAAAVGVDLNTDDPARVEENKKAVLSITDETALAALYPPVYPAGDSSMHPPTPTCAADLTRWTTKTSSTWGFDWASAPDAASLALMKSQPNAGEVPDQAWSDACADEVSPSLCSHAMFVDCDKATPGQDQITCTEWNTRIGALFGGTVNWIDQNTSFSDRLSNTLTSLVKATPQYQAGKMYVDGFSWAWDTFTDSAAAWSAFIDNPATIIGDWANELKSSALSVSTSVLHGLAAVGEFDPATPEFLAIYAVSTGIGLLVMSLMTLLAIHKSSDGTRPAAELAKDLFGYAPAGVMMMVFAPMLAQLIISAAHALTESLLTVIGTSTDEVIVNISSALGALTESTLIGGPIAAIIGFFLMVLGALAMFFGFLLHQAALPVLGVVSGVAFGMWVHPTWRKKALRPVLTFLGIVLAKPMLFLLLGAVFVVLNIAASGSVADDGELESLASLGLVAVCFVMIGLAPFALLKWAPIMPTSADSADFGGGGSTAGQTLGSSMSMFQQRAGGSGGGPGGGSPSHHTDAAGAPGRASEHTSSAAGGAGSTGDRPGGRDRSGSHSGPTPGTGQSRNSKGGRSSVTGGGTGGAAQSKLLGAVGAGVGVAAGVAAVAAPIAVSAAGAAMNKAGSAAQNAPEHADGDT